MVALRCSKYLFVIYFFHRKEMLEQFCDELPTSLVYIDTSATPHKVIGHVLVEKSDDYENAVEFDLGKCNLICLSNKVITDLLKSKKD